MTSKAATVESHQSFHEIYWVLFKDGSRKLATKNSTPKRKIYNEELVRHKGIEYRIWDPFRSKFAAAILKGLDTVPIKPNHKVLYLGAASGTTASHISDIVREKGHVYCVEFSARTIRDLVNNVCTFRPNMSPILADARFPHQYSNIVEMVDDIYCDIAQPQQAKVLTDNANLFLKPKGWIMLTIKARSIDVTKLPSEVFDQEIDVLKTYGFTIEKFLLLEPFDKAHAMIVATR